MPFPEQLSLAKAILEDVNTIYPGRFDNHPFGQTRTWIRLHSSAVGLGLLSEEFHSNVYWNYVRDIIMNFWIVDSLVSK